jgi:inhibitor of cysteine peptidase
MVLPCDLGIVPLKAIMAQIVVSNVQDGHVLTARVGDSISLELPGNPTTGYTWALTSVDETRLEVQDSGYVSAGLGVGGGGLETWNLKAREPGMAHIELTRRRPWEGEKSIVSRFSVTLNILSG